MVKNSRKNITIEEIFQLGLCYKESNFGIYEVTKDIKDIKNVIEIDLSERGLNEIPDFLWNFINLKKLNLNKNNIKKLKNLEGLTNLTHLDVEDNLITKIEGTINLKKLNTLNLFKNKIKKIENLTNIIVLKNLYLDENPLKYSKYKNLESFGFDFLDIENNEELYNNYNNEVNRLKRERKEIHRKIRNENLKKKRILEKENIRKFKEYNKNRIKNLENEEDIKFF
jgi:hypothetical protein